jgi:hypothetical protein
MLHVWKLIITLHRRKKHILWLIICAVFIFLCIPILNSISLWEGLFVNSSFQHQITEIIGLLFLLYFGSTTLSQLNQNKITQLLWSKKKEPISFISQIRWGVYSIYIFYILLTVIAILLIQGFDIHIIMWYSNLIISWGIILTIIMMLSLLTNSYAAMVWALIIYSISYSINFIIFSTPISFQETFSFKVLTVLQYLFPRFDILYSTLWREWLRSVWGNILYWIVIYYIFVYIFLDRYNR